MWQCADCDRWFKQKNQSHICTQTTIDELFAGRPDKLVMAFDQLLVGVIDWEPCTVGTSTKTIVFTKKKAWLIVKPMRKELDLKFYFSSLLEHPRIHKTTTYGSSVAHHIRIAGPDQVDDNLLELLQQAFMQS